MAGLLSFWGESRLGSVNLKVPFDGIAVNAGSSIMVTKCAEPLVGAYNVSGVAEQFANALIDEVEIYNRALSASEIEDIFNAGGSGKCKRSSAMVVTIEGLKSEVDARNTGASTINGLNGKALKH